MYVHLGQSAVVPKNSIVGIFDLDNASWSHRTRAFLERAEREGRLISLGEDLPKSFVICQEGKNPGTVYISQLASATVRGRAEQNGI